MKKLSIIAALALATMWTWTPAIAGINGSVPYFPAGTPSIGASSAGTIGASGLGNAAGSIAAGANSALNPSGNSFIVPPPGASAGVFIGPRR
jgi:hypothetical protein